MNDSSDQQLLREYASRRSESAFAEIVRRHIDLVYSAALRLVGGAQAAEDVTQTVFVALARQAPQLARHPALSGWLHCTTRNVAAKTVRSDVRRQVREEEAAVMNELLANDAAAIWEHIAPHLDAALGELSAAERDAVLLRYFEKKSAQEMAQILGVSHEAAQKRVNRAVEKLRDIFAKHGVTAGAGGLATIISINAVQAAPAGLGATIATASILSAGSGTFTIMKIMTITKIKLGISALAVAGATMALVIQHQTQNKLQDENGLLQQQVVQLRTDNGSFSNRLAAAGDVKKLPDDQFNELLKLRGEVGVLRRQNESQKAQISQNEAIRKNTQFIGHTPGTYISKEQLSDAGYATPETALETINWAMMSGTYDQVEEGLSPEILADELKNTNAREDFEKQQKIMAPLFKGMQIVAEKSLADDRVELKIKMDADPVPGQANQQPSLLIQPMVKVGNEWKLGGSTRSYSDNWENNGQVQTFVP